MRRALAIALVALAATAATLAAPSIVAADVDAGSGGEGGVIFVNTLIEPRSESTGGSNGGGGGGSGLDCTDAIRASIAVDGNEPTVLRDGGTFDLYLVAPTCGGPQGAAGLMYVRRVTPEELLPGLRERVAAQLPVSEVTFAPLDAQFGWVYVNVPTDFRLASSAAPVSVSSSLSNGIVTVWASVTATPTLVTFSPGEPRGFAVSCSVADAQVGYSAASPGACSYRYRDSSAISGNGRTFSTSVAVEWEVSYATSSGSGTFPPIVRSTDRELGVAEIQAVVTCTGSRPEQGGC